MSHTFTRARRGRLPLFPRFSHLATRNTFEQYDGGRLRSKILPDRLDDSSLNDFRPRISKPRFPPVRLGCHPKPSRITLNPIHVQWVAVKHASRAGTGSRYPTKGSTVVADRSHSISDPRT
ncbi:hypothetical protein LIA77_02809 [Sarocladium implicatum]|nr:hypothetical protein LIA77_02809 [Sarocladium implicatum]